MNVGFFLASVQLTAGGLIIILGLVLLRESPRNPLNRLVALLLFFAGLGATLGSSDFLIPQINPKLEQRGVDLVSEFSYLWEFFFPYLLLFSLSFPRTHPFVQRHGSVRWVLFLPYIGHLLLVGLHAILGDSFGFPTDAEASVFWAIPRLFVSLVFDLHRTLFSLVNVAYVLMSLLILRGSVRRATQPALRSQLRVIAWGMGFCAVLSLMSPIGRLVAPESARVVSSSVRLLALMVGCGSIAFAMVRYRFLDASVLVRRAILYAISTGIVVGLYLTVVNQIDGFVRALTGLDVPAFRAVALVLSLIFFQPFLAKLEETLEGLLLRERTDPRTALHALSERIMTRLDPGNVGQVAVDSIRESLLTDRVALVRFQPGSPPALHVSADHADAFGGPEHLPTAADLEEVRGLSPVAVRGERAYVLPLRLSGEFLGALVLGRKLTGGRYSREDETLLSSIANQVSVALKNAELYAASLKQVEMERDLETARQIQRSFLPTRFPKRDGIEVFGRNVPSREVGGDYYDVLEQGSGSVFLAVADVSGKGVPAALLASMLQASLRTQAASEKSVQRIMERMNELVCASTSSEQFATFFLARVDLPSMRLTYANAGHNFPILVRDDRRTSVLDHSDLLLGFVPGVEYREVSVDLRSGDRLVLFTDGISEARLANQTGDAEELLGEERLARLLLDVPCDGSANQYVDAIEGQLQTVVTDEDADDRTLLVLQIGGGGMPA